MQCMSSRRSRVSSLEESSRCLRRRAWLCMEELLYNAYVPPSTTISYVKTIAKVSPKVDMVDGVIRENEWGALMA